MGSFRHSDERGRSNDLQPVSGSDGYPVEAWLMSQERLCRNHGDDGQEAERQGKELEACVQGMPVIC